MSNETQTTLGVGLHYGVPAAVYHADPCPAPSISSGIAQIILESSPAHAALDHPRITPGPRSATNKPMRFGSLVHAYVSGEESEIVIGEYSDFRKNEAKEWRDGVADSGRVPILRHEFYSQRGTISAIMEKSGNGCDNKPFASRGQSEVTAIWKEGDVFCRARFDRLVIDADGFTADIWDWKTTGDISEAAIRRRIEDSWYFMRAAFYVRGLNALMPSLGGRVSFFWCFVETTPPHAVRRIPLCEAWKQWGDAMASRAILSFGDCLKKGEWKDPMDGLTLSLAPSDWFTRKMEELS